MGDRTEALERTEVCLQGLASLCESWRDGNFCIQSRSRGVEWLSFSKRSVHKDDSQEQCRWWGLRGVEGRLPGLKYQETPPLSSHPTKTRKVELLAPYLASIGMRSSGL